MIAGGTIGSATCTCPAFAVLSSNKDKFPEAVSDIRILAECSASFKVFGSNTLWVNAGLEVLILNALSFGKTDRLDTTALRLVLGTVGLENIDFAFVAMEDFTIDIDVGPCCVTTGLVLLFVLLLVEYPWFD